MAIKRGKTTEKSPKTGEKSKRIFAIFFQIPTVCLLEVSQGFAVEKNSTAQPSQVISVFRGFLLRFLVFSTLITNFRSNVTQCNGQRHRLVPHDANLKRGVVKCINILTLSAVVSQVPCLRPRVVQWLRTRGLCTPPLLPAPSNSRGRIRVVHLK